MSTPLALDNFQWEELGGLEAVGLRRFFSTWADGGVSLTGYACGPLVGEAGASLLEDDDFPFAWEEFGVHG